MWQSKPSDDALHEAEDEQPWRLSVGLVIMLLLLGGVAVAAALCWVIFQGCSDPVLGLNRWQGVGSLLPQ